MGSYLTKLLFGDKSCQVAVVGGGLPRPGKNKIIGVFYHQVNLAGPVAKTKLLPVVENSDTVVVMTPPDQRITVNILRLLSLAKSLHKVVYLSTLLVYPSGSKPAKETVKPKPFSSYEKNKIREEKWLADYCGKNKVKLSIIRLANVYGDIMNRGIIGLAFKALQNGLAVTINGSGEQVRDYIFVEDAAKLIKAVVFNRSAEPIEIFNISTGQGHTVNETLALIKKATRRNLLIHYGLPVKEKNSVVGDNAKILKCSSQKLAYDLFRGLVKTSKNYFSKHESV